VRPPSLLFDVYRGDFFSGVKWPPREAPHSLRIVPRLRISGEILPLPHYVQKKLYVQITSCSDPYSEINFVVFFLIKTHNPRCFHRCVYVQDVPEIKVTTLGFNSRADSESKTPYTHESDSQRFRSYEFLKVQQINLERKEEHCAFIEIFFYIYSYRLAFSTQANCSKCPPSACMHFVTRMTRELVTLRSTAALLMVLAALRIRWSSSSLESTLCAYTIAFM